MADNNLSDEEPDYMSDTFLAQCIPKDVRPSLIPIRKEKRKHELMKKQEESNIINKTRWKPARVLEQESREAGLQRAIGSENKGFQLLEKMGYKPGTSIGKPYDGGDAMKEPISIEVKGDRGGLGKKTAEKEKRLKIQECDEKWKKLANPDDFRQRIQAQAAHKDIERDLRKAQSACRMLDVEKHLQRPVESWFWPKPEKVRKLIEDEEEEIPDKKTKISSETDSEDEEFPEPQEQLQVVTEYLRDKYFYCIWCGANYDNNDELAKSCPGNSKEDH